MPKPFLPLTLAQFREILARFPFTRAVDVVHMHHTWRPNRSQYRGLESIESMHEFHTRERGFSDIAQHITIAPDGTIWTGRNWNISPASAVGHNGNPRVGPFMFEMIGDFDTGKDAFEDPQRETVLQVIVAVQKKFGLPAEALRFHRQMSTKTCPGSGIDLAGIVELVRARHAVVEGARDLTEAPFSRAYREDPLTGVQRSAVDAAVDALRADATAAESMVGAELPESDQEVVFTGTGRMTTAAARGVEVTAADLIALRAHVINLSQGSLVRGGEFFTLPEDVERIFGEDMERAFRDPQSMGMPPRASAEPFRIMFWAHGGLISEENGLAIAQKHVTFWKANGIYPVYFVWETGLLRTVGHLLRGLLPGAEGARNFFSDNVSDPLIETAARAAGGEKIWSGMKRNAELSATPAGGGTKTAAELKRFLDRHDRAAVNIHAAGHSAGAIFQAHFLPLALGAGVPEIASLHLLAPAIRVDTFANRLLGLVGKGVKRLNLFTMVKEQELDDTCAAIYRKSLLYLIRFSLERDESAEILGLEECLRRDRAVAKLFGFAGAPSQGAEALFSPSFASDGPNATRSTTHGGFDDDAPTMNSVALRILGLSAKAQLKMSYPEGQRALSGDPWTVPEVEDLHRSFLSSAFGGGWWKPPAAPAPPPASPGAVSGPAAVSTPGGRGRRRALCVGIDRYPVSPLAGCVRDARLWAKTLGRFGFESDLMLDGDATYANIGAGLERLIRTARSGDVIVWQYSGHGTQVPDVNGDEAGGDSAGRDEAICPVDLQTGRMFVDDQIAALIGQLPPGVAFTMIMDCCHSGTLNRFGFGEPPDGSAQRDERARFLPLTDDLRLAYLKFAQESAGGRGTGRSRTRAAIQTTNEVLFTACLSTEVAWESNGQGEFTVRATRLLEERGLAFTNEEFINAITRAFGSSPRQTPTIACGAGLRARGLLTPQGEGPQRGIFSTESTPDGAGNLGRLADAAEAFARELRRV